MDFQGLVERAIETTGETAHSVVYSSSYNQLSRFTAHQVFVQRVLAVASSSTSIVFCLISFYAFLAIDPRRLVFRHHLIAFLLFFDLLKAVILLLYPSRVLSKGRAYYNNNFCQIVGFFTAFSIEGADLAIFSFAIHTFILIFKPHFTGKDGLNQGGLYRVRYLVYVTSFIVPIILASLAYIGEGYSALVCWCYLPLRPVWYRFVLSWVPRYVIVVVIIAVYCSIYFHVVREFKQVEGMYVTMHAQRQRGGGGGDADGKLSFFSAIRYFIRRTTDRLLCTIIIPDLGSDGSRSSGTKKGNDSSDRSQNGGNKDESMGESKLQMENIKKFKKRQKMIQKQVKSIFVYPFAYCFVWLFPFIMHITQVNYEEKHHPIYWLNCMGAFMQPFNGFVDTLVFFYRERPWEYTIIKTFERENRNKINDMLVQNDNADEISNTTSARATKNSLSASLGVDLNTYPRWRRWASKLRLPLFKLPTEENISEVQQKHWNNRMECLKATRNQSEQANNIFDSRNHDFSNVLFGDIAKDDFRANFAKYELFNAGSGNDRSKNSPHNNMGLWKPRAASIVDPLDKSAFNANRKVSSPFDTPSRSIDNSVRKNADGPFMNSSKTAESSNMTSNSGELDAIFGNSSRSSKSSQTRRSSRSSSMDFMEFLQKGP
ncbi:Piso0_005656 [Millerozyma farinosa CBS 7064]|uniref:Piso0_005656 protein n=1 Tax=Pichia sorbitophila (strain ATCC MYA-4447 / BCRC 22081 / CBS 7064 / NBRC 10061 / NRRL Y-12695) TaxID=559304 RepID=G8Y2K1_PICSO|nr:Piso0_005656 [Millerozyma farinosa CBS 7064]